MPLHLPASLVAAAAAAIAAAAATMQVACALWAATWLGSYLTLYWAVLLGWVGAFTVPITLKKLQPSLAAVTASIRARTIVSGDEAVGAS
jgi:uncharacterized membrane protein